MPAAEETVAQERAAGEAVAGKDGAPQPQDKPLSEMPRGQAAEKAAAGRFAIGPEERAAASSPRPSGEPSAPEAEAGKRLVAEAASAPGERHLTARTPAPAQAQGFAPASGGEDPGAASRPPAPEASASGASEAAAPRAAAKRELNGDMQAASSPDPAAEPADSPEAGPAASRGLKAEAPLSPRAPVSPAAADRELPGLPSRSQVFDPIVQRASLQVRGGREEIRIELKPEFLGPVRMQIATAHQAVSVRILAEVPLVRDWIEAGLAQLKSDLEQQGLRVEKLEVAVAADGREGSARREEFRGPGAFPPAPDAGPAPRVGPAPPPGWEVAPGLRHAAAGRGRLDLFA